MSKIAEPIRYQMALDSGDDPWGWAMEHMFAQAELLYFRGDGDVPAELAFHASPVRDDIDDTEWPEGEYAEIFALGEFTSDDLRYSLRVLSRYANLLKHAGLDY